MFAYNLLGSEPLTVSSTPVTLTASVYNATSAGATSQREYPMPGNQKAAKAVVETLTNAIWYTLDGTTPSSTNGHLLNAGDQVTLENYTKIKNFKAIRTAGSDATVYITYYK